MAKVRVRSDAAHHAKWLFETGFPGADYGRIYSAVEEPALVEATGLDGRYDGALRVFPGFADETVHGLDTTSLVERRYLDGDRQAYSWQLSGSGTDEYYAEISDAIMGGAGTSHHYPEWHAEPDYIYIGDTQLSRGTAGSLAGDEWDWADNDSLGANTVYVRSGQVSNPTEDTRGPINARWDRTLTNVVYAKYVSAQQGLTDEVKNGLVLLADSSTGSGIGKTLYFLYYDSLLGATIIEELDDFDHWFDLKLSSLGEYGVASLRRFVYFVSSGGVEAVDDTSGYTGVDWSGVDIIKKWPMYGFPYNKTFYFSNEDHTSFSDAEWASLQHRFMGCLPSRFLSARLPRRDSLGAQSDPTTVFDLGGIAGGNYYDNDQLVTGAMQFLYFDHGLRSHLFWDTEDTGSSTGSFEWEAKRASKFHGYPEKRYQTLGATTSTNDKMLENGCLAGWGIQFPDTVHASFYRTTALDKGAFDFQNEDLVGALYLQAQLLATITAGPDTRKYGEHNQSFHVRDGGLTVQESFNFTHDTPGTVSRMKRIAAYQGLLVGVVDRPDPDGEADNWFDTIERPQSIVWSTTYRNEPENFPASNRYSLDNPAENVLELEPAGDFLFAVTNANVYRIVRAGARLAISPVLHGIGGVSRWGQTGVGNSLFVLTSDGLKEIRGDGQVRNVKALYRLLTHENEWGGTLANVHMEYDAAAGCLILLNTNKKEAVLLWEKTGAMTRLVDCPWKFLTRGPNFSDSGVNRAYWVTDTGRVHCIDANRDMDKAVMCGASSGETVNGSATGGDTTTLQDTAAVFPENCEGFYLWMLSGDSAGTRTKIVSRDSDTQLTVEALPSGISSSDRYAVAPVVVDIRTACMETDGGADRFGTAIGTNVSVALANLGGETNHAQNGKLELGLFRQNSRQASTELAFNENPDRMNAYYAVRSTALQAFLRCRGANMDFEVQAILVTGTDTTSEQQTVQDY